MQHGTRPIRDPRIRRSLLPNEREVLLARLLLRVCDAIGTKDSDQEFLELYNETKVLAEGTIRGASQWQPDDE